jgi:branched-chain amino acid transport system substrate-binding protein
VIAHIYKQAARAAGLSVVGDYTFPVGTSDFSSFINDAKAKEAELVIAQTVPPDGIALWKQMKALALRPKAAFSTKAAVSGAWWQALGSAAEGTLTEGFWAASPQDPRTAPILGSLGKQLTNLPDLGLAVVSQTGTQVLLDAITAAGASDPEAINNAVAKTNKNYLVGQVVLATGIRMVHELAVLGRRAVSSKA